MKTFCRSTLCLCLLLLAGLKGKSQLINENFNAGLPTVYTQSPAASWSLSPNLGTAGSGCAYTQELNTTTVTASLRTPTLNLSSVNNLTVTFKAAVVGNNFIVPNVALSYDAGSGMQFVARWGSGFSSNTTYTITGAYDFNPPLDAQYVNWFNCTQTISAISSTIVSFIFDGELINGGYVLIDDIVIKGNPIVTTGLSQNEQTGFINVFPNPAIDKKVRIEGGDIKSVFIFDNLGRVVTADLIKDNSAVELNLDKLSTGIYYITAVTGDNILIRKKMIVE